MILDGPPGRYFRSRIDNPHQSMVSSSSKSDDDESPNNDVVLLLLVVHRKKLLKNNDLHIPIHKHVIIR